MAATLRIADLANDVGLSTQQLRNLEAEGLLPPAERTAAGQRVYLERHRLALRLERTMIRAGFNGVQRRMIMHAAHARDPDAALQLVVERFVEIDLLRRQVDEVIERARELEGPDAVGRNRLRIGEAARVVGVTAGALRHWEREGLIKPARERPSGYRTYDRRMVHRARVIARLVELGFGIPVLRAVIDDLVGDHPHSDDATEDVLRGHVRTQVRACAEVISLLWHYLTERH